MTARRQVRNVDNTTRQVLINAAARIEVQPLANSGSRSYVENTLYACDAPNEWFFDASTQTLYYVPPTSEHDPRQMEFIVPQLNDTLVRLENTSDIRVRGISFEHTDWPITPTLTQSGTVQAASFLPIATVHLVHAQSCLFDAIRVEQVGSYGVWIDTGSHHNVLSGAFVGDVGAGAVRIGRGKPLTPDSPASERPFNNTVVDSTLVLGSLVFAEGNGVLLQQARSTRIVRCQVAFFDHCAVSVGWTWDYEASQASNNLIRDCDIHNIGNAELSDFGGICTNKQTNKQTNTNIIFLTLSTNVL